MRAFATHTYRAQNPVTNEVEETGSSVFRVR